MSRSKKNPVSVQLRNDGASTGGNLEIDSGKHTYLVGTNDTTFNFKNSFGNRDYDPRWGVYTDYNVRLMTDNGIRFYESSNVITAKNAILYGGTGNIGGQGQNEALKLDMTGALEANSAKSVYLRSVQENYPLTIQSIAAGENIRLDSDYAPIVMSTETGKDTGRLTGAGINITSARNIGVAGNGLRITNNGANVTLRTYGGDTFVHGIGKGILNFRSLSTYGKFGFITDGTASGLQSKQYRLANLEKFYYGR